MKMKMKKSSMITAKVSIKPRNPFVIAEQQMRPSGAGAHTKPEKSLRQQAKRDLKKQMS